MGSDRLTDIVKERYETGAHGRTHFIMSRATFEALRVDRDERQPRWAVRNTLGDLLDIPVALDPDLPLGFWRLVDTTTKAVIEDGISAAAITRDSP